MLTTIFEEMERERKSRSFKIDEVVLQALALAAKKKNTSVNRLVENVLMDYCKSVGTLDNDTEPLGETRGVPPSPKETQG
uniref:CopG-like ribbon-helix-helix domain-containing protein n=1 Tax=Tolypothrix bouteillei VB521301 TaxID=1479485 RepID=A0A0C1MVP4_9CYAN